ncbi:hypothetical protein Pelo_9605 [Pelomyxa schiedti]|nr:hypothetical protein Pelo_9605 [Pelomyxa schiedti]
MGHNFSSEPPTLASLEAKVFARHTLDGIKSLRSSQGRLWARLMRACVKGGATKVRAAAESVPVGDERQVAARESSHLREYNVIHVCAHLGHLAEMNVILNTWASRPPYNTMMKADAMKWLVDEVSSDGYTSLTIAVRNRYTDIAECLVTEWHADTMYCSKGTDEGAFCNWNVLHFCAAYNQYKCADLILSSCDTSMKISLLQCLGGGGSHTPLETAIQTSYCVETVMAIANPKWGQPVLSAMEERKPLLFAAMAQSDSSFEYLCSVFSEGLIEILVTARSRFRRKLLDYPKFSSIANQPFQLHGGTVTPLYFAVAKGSINMVIKLLALGADPNVVCALGVEWFCEQFKPYRAFDLYPWGSSPMTLAVATLRKDMVQEMARCGGILTPKFCRRWSKYDPAFSLASYLDGSWEEHLERLSDHCSELHASMPLLSYSLVPVEFIVSESITSMMIQYKAEITGVLELLDIKSLGRIQRTSKFWYQMGRSNSLWKSALLNSSMKWERKIRDQLILSTQLLDNDSTKWKHAAFFWVARNLCVKCGHKYRQCDAFHCRSHNRKHVPRYVYKELDQFSATLQSLSSTKNREWEMDFVVVTTNGGSGCRLLRARDQVGVLLLASAASSSPSSLGLCRRPPEATVTSLQSPASPPTTAAQPATKKAKLTDECSMATTGSHHSTTTTLMAEGHVVGRLVWDLVVSTARVFVFEVKGSITVEGQTGHRRAQRCLCVRVSPLLLSMVGEIDDRAVAPSSFQWVDDTRYLQHCSGSPDEWVLCSASYEKVGVQRSGDSSTDNGVLLCEDPVWLFSRCVAVNSKWIVLFGGASGSCEKFLFLHCLEEANNKSCCLREFAQYKVPLDLTEEDNLVRSLLNFCKQRPDELLLIVNTQKKNAKIVTAVTVFDLEQTNTTGALCVLSTTTVCSSLLCGITDACVTRKQNGARCFICTVWVPDPKSTFGILNRSGASVEEFSGHVTLLDPSFTWFQPVNDSVFFIKDNAAYGKLLICDCNHPTSPSQVDLSSSGIRYNTRNLPSGKVWSRVSMESGFLFCSDNSHLTVVEPFTGFCVLTLEFPLCDFLLLSKDDLYIASWEFKTPN